MQLKTPFLLFVFMSIGLLAMSSAHAYFYGSLAMKNPKTKKIVVLVGDAHLIKDTPSEEDKVLIKKQALGFRDAVAEIQKRNGKDSVLVIAEDHAHFFSMKNINYSIKLPLDHIVTRSRAVGIPAINVEFREEDTNAIEVIEENTKDKTLKSRIEDHYKHQVKEKMAYIIDDVYLDIAIINALRNSDAPFIFIAAGAAHIGSVSKILYQDGYTDVVMQIGDSVVGCYKEFLYCYNTMEALRRFEAGPVPEPLDSVKDAMLTLLDKLEDTPEVQ